MRRPEGARVPVTIITGYLGAGKTTLLRKLLTSIEGAGTMVIVNEFGEIGIDQALIQSSSDRTVLLGNGCLCCRVRTDLQETLLAMLRDRMAGQIPDFRQVLIETSELADPTALLQTFVNDRALAEEFYLRAMVTVVDAAVFAVTRQRAPELVNQVALADLVLVTKTDIVPPEVARAVHEEVRALNAEAPVYLCTSGDVDPAFVLGNHAIARFASGYTATQPGHLDGIFSFALQFDRPLRWEPFALALRALAKLRGPDLLRVKGLIRIHEANGPVLIHLVQHLVHPPMELQAWPGGDEQSRLVFITRGISRDQIVQVLDALQEVASASADRQCVPAEALT